MAAKRKVTNLLGLAFLAYLSQQPMHPYELGRILREHGDDRSIKFHHGSLYTVAQQLTAAGFIAEAQTSRQGQWPERTVYTLTPSGRRELLEWMRELVAEPVHEYPRFAAALSLISALPPSVALSLLYRRRDRLSEQRDAIRALIDDALDNGVPALYLVEEEYRLDLVVAEHAFVVRFADQITHPGTEWIDTLGRLPPRGQSGPDGRRNGDEYQRRRRARGTRLVGRPRLNGHARGGLPAGAAVRVP